jgi:hypothetical protein
MRSEFSATFSRKTFPSKIPENVANICRRTHGRWSARIGRETAVETRLLTRPPPQVARDLGLPWFSAGSTVSAGAALEAAATRGDRRRLRCTPLPRPLLGGHKGARHKCVAGHARPPPHPHTHDGA